MLVMSWIVWMYVHPLAGNVTSRGGRFNGKGAYIAMLAMLPIVTSVLHVAEYYVSLCPVALQSHSHSIQNEARPEWRLCTRGIALQCALFYRPSLRLSPFGSGSDLGSRINIRVPVQIPAPNRYPDIHVLALMAFNALVFIAVLVHSTVLQIQETFSVDPAEQSRAEKEK
jgi:hypothetical protein